MAKKKKGGGQALARPDDEEGQNNALMQVRRAAGLPMEAYPDERLKTIWRMAAPDAQNVSEFAAFMSLCDRYDLDPIAGEAWFGRMKGKPTLLTGRDTYIRVASDIQTFDGISQGLVYEDDEFWYERSEEDPMVLRVHHRCTGMGDLKAAYCAVYDRNRPPIMWVARLDHYSHLLESKDNWKLYPGNMLQNRAVTSAFRLAYPLSGLHVEGEEISEEEVRRALDSDTADRTRAVLAGLREELQAAEEEAQEPEAPDDEGDVLDAEVIDEEEAVEAVADDEEAGRGEEPAQPPVENGELPFDAPEAEEADEEADEDEPPPTAGDPEEFEQARENAKRQLRRRQYFASLAELDVSDAARKAWQAEHPELPGSTKEWDADGFQEAIHVLEEDGAMAFLVAHVRQLADAADVDFERMEKIELAINDGDLEAVRNMLNELIEED